MLKVIFIYKKQQRIKNLATRNSFHIFITYKTKMNILQNIHSLLQTSIQSITWASSVCGDITDFMLANNEYKQPRYISGNSIS